MTENSTSNSEKSRVARDKLLSTQSEPATTKPRAKSADASSGRNVGQSLRRNGGKKSASLRRADNYAENDEGISDDGGASAHVSTNIFFFSS